MSDTTEVITENVTTPAPKKSRKDVPFSSCHVRFASSKGIDVTRAAKLNRSYVRSNFDTLVKQWPALRASQKKNRDNNRYPEMIPAHVADQIVKRSLAASK
jgi:hypothetical protein